jgi:hypothetical protein
MIDNYDLNIILLIKVTTHTIMDLLRCNDVGITCAENSSYLLNPIFSAFLSIFGGFFLSFAFVSHLIAYGADTETDTDTDTDTDVDTVLEDMYYEELNALEVRELSKEELDALQTKMVEVDTPDGLVKMTYNHSTESFWYYTNNKSIHYKYLDAVARHFTIVNNCRQICVNYKEEYEKGVTLIKEKQLEEENQKINNLIAVDSVKKSVFAKFKNYKVTDETKQTKTTYILTDKANKFRFAGSMMDYENELKTNRQQENQVAEGIPTMDYATFKKLVMMNNKPITINNNIVDDIIDNNPLMTQL